jgi:hypothetical protein
VSRETPGGEKYPTYSKRRKTNWIAHILHGNCRLKHVIEGKIREEVTGRRGRQGKQLLDDYGEERIL